MQSKPTDFIRSLMLRPVAREDAEKLPHLGEMRSALVIINGDEDKWSITTDAVQTWLRLNRILATIVYADHRPKGSPVLLAPAVQTVSEADFLCSFIPNSKIKSALRDKVDLLLCLSPYDCFVVEYLVARCDARVKIGCASLPHCDFDIVISDPMILEKIQSAAEPVPEGEEAPKQPYQVDGVETLRHICDYLAKLQG